VQLFGIFSILLQFCRLTHLYNYFGTILLYPIIYPAIKISVSIKISQHIYSHNSTSADLVFIHSNYRILPDAILKLENQGLSVVEAFNIIKNVQNKLENVFYEVGISTHEKFKKVIEKNIGFETIIKINDILTGQGKSFDGLPEDLTVSDLAYFNRRRTKFFEV